jgi:hypothetical protein
MMAVPAASTAKSELGGARTIRTQLEGANPFAPTNIDIDEAIPALWSGMTAGRDGQNQIS